MKILNGLIGMFLGLAVSLSAHAVVDTPKHAFKNTYDELLEELPNVRSKMEESKPADDGLKHWVGAVPIGSASSVIEISGKDKNAITKLTVILLFDTKTTDADYDNAEALRDVLFQGLLGRGAAFSLLNDFWVKELARQQPIIRAGGTPKGGTKKIGNGTSEVSLVLISGPGVLSAIYSMKLL
jgi:hypothetical protein